jgi:hypothetical protein
MSTVSRTSKVAYVLIRLNGATLTVSCNDQVLDKPPKIGSIITVKHNGYYQNGTLKQPYFWRDFNTVSWDSVVPQRPLVSQFPFDKFIL